LQNLDKQFMKKEIKFIYFDVGGVLCKFKDAYKKFANLVSCDVNKFDNSISKYYYLSCLGGISTNDLWNLVSEDLELKSKEKVDFEDFFTDNLVPIKESFELVNDLVKRYKIGILTNSQKGIFEKSLEKAKVPNINYFAVIKSCDLGVMKPDSQIYKVAENKSGVSANEILFIDDLEENILAATSMGWHGVVFMTENPEPSVKNIRSILG